MELTPEVLKTFEIHSVYELPKELNYGKKSPNFYLLVHMKFQKMLHVIIEIFIKV